MSLIDSRKKVGITCTFNSTIINSITPYLPYVPCLQVCFNNYTDGYNNDGPGLKAIMSSSTCSTERLYLHTTVRTNIANTAANTKSVVPPSVRHINSALMYSSYIPSAVVVHYGSCGNLTKTIDSLYQCRIPFESNVPYPLLLENAAGQGTEIGVTVEEIRHVFERVHSARIGMCLDTCHAYAAGYEVHNPERLMTLLQELDDIAPKRLRMVHLNDSDKPFASRRDRHANITSGYIWKDNTDSLQYLLDYGAENDIDFILETPQSHADLEYIRRHHMAPKY